MIVGSYNVTYMTKVVYKKHLDPLLGKDLSTEAAQLTKRNYKVIWEFIGAIFNFVDGVLLTGSNAWGAFHAVTPSSDIDLLIAVSNIDQIDAIIDKLVTDGLTDPYDQKRFALFKTLHEEGKADQFSLIAQYSDVNVSIDFLTLETIETICGLHQMRTRIYEDTEGTVTIRVVREFRANPPKSDGYALDDLKGERMIRFHPEFEKIENEQGKILGYLSDTLVDGQTTIPNAQTYLVGVMSFFLSIAPIVLLDENYQLQKLIHTLQSHIAEILQGEIPTHITRQERMSEDTVQRIKKLLTFLKKD